MKKIIYLFVLALTFTGCSTEDDANVPEGLLKRVQFNAFAGDNITSRYYYEGFRLDRIENSDDSREVYVYDGDLIVNIKNYEDTDLVTERQYQYDDTGQLIQYLRIDKTNDYNNRSIYVYNSDGTVTENGYGFHTGNPETLNFTRQFFFSGGDVTQEVITFPSGVVQTNTYTYDNMAIPEHDVKGFGKIILFERGSAEHNRTHVEQVSSADDFVGTYSLLYGYNDSGAPTFFTFDDSGTIIIDAGTWQYSYK